jgi:peptidoglycan/LPS O-acetylase OafA/YrhL
MRQHDNNFNLIRLVAACQVLAVHALNHLEFEGPLATALKVMPGVPTFFFISGLLISASYERTRSRGAKPFFVNRVLRIYPALWVCVALAALAVAFTGYLSTQRFTWPQYVAWMVGQLSFFQFYNPDFMRSFGVGVINGALWTITVELQFYALTPFLFLLLTRHHGWLLCLFLLSLALNVYLRLFPSWDRLGIKLLYVSALPWIYMFIAGFVASHLAEQTDRVKRLLDLRWLIPAYVLSMVTIGAYESNAANGINPISFFLLAGCLLKLSTARLPLPTALRQYVGRNDLSYGLYLYHMPVINLLMFAGWFTAHGNLAAAFAITACCALLSWYLVERPALKFKQ